MKKRAFLLVAALVLPSVAHAQSNEAEAKIHYQKGVDLYNEGGYTAALAELEKAYALSPHYRVLYSLALVRAQLSDFVGALRGFEEYQAAAVDESAARKAEVKERIEALQQKVAAISVKVNVDDAEIYIDDQLKGSSPVPAPLLVNPGKHTIYAKKGTVKSETKSLNLGVGQHRLALDIEGLPPTPNPNGPSSTTAPAKSDSSIGFVTIGAIATGVLAVGAVATGVLTLSARSGLEEAQDKANSRATLDDESSKVSTFALVTDILGGAAIVMGAVTLVAVLRKSPEPKTGTLQRTWMSAGPTSVSFGTRF